MGGEKPERREASFQPQQRILASLSRLSGKEPGERAVRQFYHEFFLQAERDPRGALSWRPSPALGGRTRHVRDSAETQTFDSHQCVFLPELTHWVPLETDLT